MALSNAGARRMPKVKNHYALFILNIFLFSAFSAFLPERLVQDKKEGPGFGAFS
jgi:hypothetical protein